MPEWWYRQHYKTFQGNWVDSFQRDSKRTKEFFEKRKQDQIETQLQKTIEIEVDKAVKKEIDKLLSDLFKK